MLPNLKMTKTGEMNMNALQGKRILVVDDDLTNLLVYNATLGRTGATVLQDLWTTDTVTELMKKLPVDLIVLDLMLRYNLDGYDVADKIRSHKVTKDIPVVIVSAADPGIEIPKAKARGLNGFIGKPISPTLFPQQLASILDGERVWYAPGDMND